MSKPKQFWILEDDNLFLEVTRYNPDSSDYSAYRIFHVIEYSVYEQLQKKFDEAVEFLEWYSSDEAHGAGELIWKKTQYQTDSGKRARDFLRSLDKGE